jgi:crossover junction endodeoxyribonuclease RuvC
MVSIFVRMPVNNSYKIIGIDPGTIVLGYGIIQIDNKKPSLVQMGVLQLDKYSDPYQRLLITYQKVFELIKEHKPKVMSIEAPFYGKNVQSMLKLGRSQGVAIAAAMASKIQVVEYMPKSVKQSVSGNGNASKEQLQKLIQQILGFKEQHKYLDASDAVAVALCHFYQTQSVLGKFKKASGWEDFIKQNPDKISITSTINKSNKSNI